jgi:hypothetical protein
MDRDGARPGIFGHEQGPLRAIGILAELTTAFLAGLQLPLYSKALGYSH